METGAVNLSSAVKPLEATLPSAKPSGSPVAFASLLSDALHSVDQSQVHADELARKFQSGDPGVGLEQAMIAMQKANISLQALVQVRNRLISAYHDVMNMQI